MKEGRDFGIIFLINEHSRDLLTTFSTIHSYDEYINGGIARKAILFDLFQIGELLNKLSPSFKKDFNDNESHKIIGLRNKIVHGYEEVKDDIVYDSIKNNLSLYVEKLNTFSLNRYKDYLNSFVGHTIDVEIKGIETISLNGKDYTLSYGYTSSLTNLDGLFQEIYQLNNIGEEISIKGIVTNVFYDEEYKKGAIIIAPITNLSINYFINYIKSRFFRS